MSELARALVDELQGKMAFSDAPNGLFLCADDPNQLKEFLRSDLRVELLDRRICAIYVSLREHENKNPASVLATAVLEKSEEKYKDDMRRRKKAPSEIEVNRAGSRALSMDPLVDISLMRVLEFALSQVGSQIALIIDDAENFLSTDEGKSTLFALKSARDQLNTPSQSNLLLIFSGCDEERLSGVLQSPSAPFYGSWIRRVLE